MKQLSYNKNLKRLLVCLFVMLVSCSALFGRNPIRIVDAILSFADCRKYKTGSKQRFREKTFRRTV